MNAVHQLVTFAAELTSSGQAYAPNKRSAGMTVAIYHQADNWETLAESCMLLFRSSRHWKDHQHLVFGPRFVGNLYEGRRAGAERLQRQVRRRSGRPLVVW